MSINLDLDGVTTELLISHSDGTPASTEVSLAKFEFITSRLSYDSFSDGSKDIDLISHEIRVLDTRYRGMLCCNDSNNKLIIIIIHVTTE